MLFLELQAELARTWLRLAEAGTQTLSEACRTGTRDLTAKWQGVAETVMPKPQPQLPFPFSMFGPTNPLLAPNPLLSMMFPAAIWAPSLGSWMGVPGAANPWINLFGANLFGANPFAANPFAANLFGANPFAANPFASALFGANPWSRNPWLALWQMPVALSIPSAQPSMADLVTASYRTASGHVIAAIMAPLQQPSAPPAPLWTWPMGGGGRIH